MSNLATRPVDTAVLFLTLASLVSCATAGGGVAVGSEATGSPYFSLSRPYASKAGEGLQLSGRVCRRARTTGLSPARVRLEHVSAAGDVVEVARAYVPPIYRRSDQACRSYFIRVAWPIADKEAIRACFDRGRPCPSDPQVKATIAVPVAPAVAP